MKRPRIIGLATLALLCSTLATPSAFADTLTLTLDPDRDSSYGGGAFIATVNSGPLGAPGSSFYTFCLEYGEHFSPGSTYTYVINSKALNGGVGPVGDPISIGTAYLYSQFLDSNPSSLSGADQRAYQEAIWFLEGEQASEGFGASLLAAARLALGKDNAGLMANADGAYGVVALNLTTSSGGLAQDQLARVPEAGATLLLSMSLVGLGWFARRKGLLPSGARPLNV